jgi:hypothetical protein
VIRPNPAHERNRGEAPSASTIAGYRNRGEPSPVQPAPNNPPLEALVGRGSHRCRDGVQRTSGVWHSRAPNVSRQAMKETVPKLARHVTTKGHSVNVIDQLVLVERRSGSDMARRPIASFAQCVG